MIALFFFLIFLSRLRQRQKQLNSKRKIKQNKKSFKKKTFAVLSWVCNSHAFDCETVCVFFFFFFEFRIQTWCLTTIQTMYPLCICYTQRNWREKKGKYTNNKMKEKHIYPSVSSVGKPICLDFPTCSRLCNRSVRFHHL